LRCPLVTWDPDFFNQGNLSSQFVDVKVSAYLLNSTTNEQTGDRIDLSDPIKGNLGFFTWKVDSGRLGGQSTVNVSLLLLYGQTVGGGPVKNITGPTLLVQPQPIYHGPPPKVPAGPALYIGLPTILGFIILCLFGTCLWNRHRRKIGLGNIMSRGRHGYGIGESRAQRIAKSVRRSMRRGKDQGGIQLVERDGPPAEEYRDAPEPRGNGVPRRDSDALGGPGDRFQDQAVGGGRNLFRNEMQRQERERY
jgi:Ykl077w/Psg1 (Pma1 Stabilization in Golgi)